MKIVQFRPNIREKVNYIDGVIQYIEDNIAEEINGDKLAAAGYVSRAKLYRDFYSVVGCPLKEYVRKRRLSNALNLLKQSNLSLADIAYTCGYSSQQAFCRVMQSVITMTPLEYKNYDYFYYFPPYRGESVCEVVVEHETIPRHRILRYYSPRLGNIEEEAVRKFMSCMPSYAGRLYGKSGTQRKGRFCYELYASIEDDDIDAYVDSFEVGAVIAETSGLYATTSVANNPRLINSAWNYLYSIWLTRSMYESEATSYMEEYIVEDGMAKSLVLYIPVQMKKELMQFRIEECEEMHILAAEAEEPNAEHKATRTVIKHIATYYPEYLRYIQRFYVKVKEKSLVYGVFMNHGELKPMERSVKEIVIPKRMYLVLEGKQLGNYEIYEDMINNFASDNGLTIYKSSMFGMYHTDYGFHNPRLSMYCEVAMK